MIRVAQLTAACIKSCLRPLQAIRHEWKKFSVTARRTTRTADDSAVVRE